MSLLGIDIGTGATQLTLPNNPNLRIMAVSAAKNANDATTSSGFLYE